MGLSAPFFNSVFMALIQTKVEPEYLGRVLGLTGAIMTLAPPWAGTHRLFADATGVPSWFRASRGNHSAARRDVPAPVGAYLWPSVIALTRKRGICLHLLYHV